MVKVAQELDLPQDALGIYKIVESTSDLLDGNFLPRLCVERGNHYSIRAVSYELHQLELSVHLPVSRQDPEIDHTYDAVRHTQHASVKLRD